jgi:hypothetical protein
MTMMMMMTIVLEMSKICNFISFLFFVIPTLGTTAGGAIKITNQGNDGGYWINSSNIVWKMKTKDGHFLDYIPVSQNSTVLPNDDDSRSR